MQIGNKYFIDDPETGLFEVSKEYYDSWNEFRLKLMEQVLPKTEFKGRIIVFGTPGDLDTSTDFHALFYEPKNYNLK